MDVSVIAMHEQKHQNHRVCVLPQHTGLIYHVQGCSIQPDPTLDGSQGYSLYGHILHAHEASFLQPVWRPDIVCSQCCHQRGWSAYSGKQPLA